MAEAKTDRRQSASVKQSTAAAPKYLHDRNGLLRCRVCRCSDREPCNPPCGWDPDDNRGDLCTSCSGVIEHMLVWFDYAHRPTKAALMRELDLRIRDEMGDGVQ